MVRNAGVDMDVLSLLPSTADTGDTVETAALGESEADCVAKLVLVAATFVCCVVVTVGSGTVELCCVLSDTVLFVLLCLSGIVVLLFEVFILPLLDESLYESGILFSWCVVTFLLFLLVLCPVVSIALWIVAGLIKMCRAKESAIKRKDVQSNLLHRSMAIQMSFVPFKRLKQELYSFTKAIKLC